MEFNLKFEVGERVYWIQNKDTIFAGRVASRALTYTEKEEEGDEELRIVYSCRRTDSGNAGPTIYNCKEDILYGSMEELIKNFDRPDDALAEEQQEEAA